ncbi:hypothetical protein BDW75DRAFT_243778 [Aspergillus navahoensis]
MTRAKRPEQAKRTAWNPAEPVGLCVRVKVAPHPHSGSSIKQSAARRGEPAETSTLSEPLARFGEGEMDGLRVKTQTTAMISIRLLSDRRPVEHKYGGHPEGSGRLSLHHRLKLLLNWQRAYLFLSFHGDTTSHSTPLHSLDSPTMHLIPVGLLALTAQLGLVLGRPMGDGASDPERAVSEWTIGVLKTDQHYADLRNRGRMHNAAKMVADSTNENEKAVKWTLGMDMDTAPNQPNTNAARMIAPNGKQNDNIPDWTLGMGADMDAEQPSSDSKMMDGQNMNSNVKRQTVVPIPDSSASASLTTSHTTSTTTASATPSPTVPGEYGSYGGYGNYGEYASYGDYDGNDLESE